MKSVRAILHGRIRATRWDVATPGTPLPKAVVAGQCDVVYCTRNSTTSLRKDLKICEALELSTRDACIADISCATKFYGKLRSDSTFKQ